MQDRHPRETPRSTDFYSDSACFGDEWDFTPALSALHDTRTMRFLRGHEALKRLRQREISDAWDRAMRRLTAPATN
jgi:hypothetical protein